MIVITGAAGFIGSYVAQYFNEIGFKNLLLVDDFSVSEKNANWQPLQYFRTIPRNTFLQNFDDYSLDITAIIHLGARTDTTLFDEAIFNELNVLYSKGIWQICTQLQIPLIYASSAATYGNGEQGYSDNEDLIPNLKPLNPYGWSKHRFDVWALEQTQCPPKWYGLKFFNVYGPNEYHKKRMASVVFHAYKQIQQNGSLNLFKSYNPNFEHGKQLRDFIYVKDIAKIIAFLLKQQAISGIYNVGTGQAKSFVTLGSAVFDALNLPKKINYIDMPADIRNTYQYYTKADISKLTTQGYNNPLTNLESGVIDYVNGYLTKL